MDNVAHAVEQTFREQSGRMLAALIGGVRDFTVAEDALQEACIAALQQWPREGVPRNPAAWLTAVARRRAIDRLRREATLSRKHELLAALAGLGHARKAAQEEEKARNPAARPTPPLSSRPPAPTVGARVAPPPR